MSGLETGSPSPIERAVIFGAGSRGREVCLSLGEQAAIVGFTDNDRALHYTTVFGRPVYPPSALPRLDFDVVYIASAHVGAIRRQLIDEGIPAAGIRLAPGLATDVATPPRLENLLSKYLISGYEEMAGWLSLAAVEATLMLADLQRRRVAPGPICEIGVWEGRYLTLLSFIPDTPQPVLAIDPLEHSANRAAQIDRLRRNIATYARRPDLVSLMERDSKEVSAERILATVGARCQFVSIDGDHTVEGAMHDLQLAEAIAAPGGIVALDDVPNFSCPGVTEAIVRHSQAAGHQLAPFLLVANKLFLTQAAHCEEYRREIVSRAERGQAGEWGQRIINHRASMHHTGAPARFLGQELLVGA